MAADKHLLLLIIYLVLSNGVAADDDKQDNKDRRNTVTKQDINFLRRKLNDEKRQQKEQDRMASDANPRMEPNFTSKFDGSKKLQLEILRARGSECDFEGKCTWTWRTDVTPGFAVAIANNTTGPKTDADDRHNGHFLLLRLKSKKEMDWTVTSPLLDPTRASCKIQFRMYQEKMNSSLVRVVLHNVHNVNNVTQVMLEQIPGDDARSWIKYEKTIGTISQKFQVMLEVVQAGNYEGLVAFDNIKLLKCYPERDKSGPCTPNQYQCSNTNECISNSEVCDITSDCPRGDDETQNCDKIPFGGRCNFEHGWCGWYNIDGKALEWIRYNETTAANSNNTVFDHTYRNSTGKYLYVKAVKGSNASFASTATLKSVIFNPPPRVHGNTSSRYYNSCMIRFYLHQSSNHKSGFMLQVTELRPKENVSTDLFWSFNSFPDPWFRQVIVLPNITYKYFLHFEVRKGIIFVNDIAIDDVSLSPECFGLNIPSEELKGYNYWDPNTEPPSEVQKDFANETYYEISTCNVSGRFGPVQDNCTTAYTGTEVIVRVLREPGLNGVQRWIVPSDNYYTFILYGASGGKGSSGMGSSKGAMIRVVLELRKGQELYMLIGQEGTSACVKILGDKTSSACRPMRGTNYDNISGIRGVLNMEIADGGGGGGGATFLFIKSKKTRDFIPIAVASGGGGIGFGKFEDTGLQHGQGINNTRAAISGKMYGEKSAGSGGGWEPYPGKIALDHQSRQGQAFLSGAFGGEACYTSTQGQGNGGFGGGGGGCVYGGGGGGYSGGSSNTTNGEGGYSYIDTSKSLSNYSQVESGYHRGPGVIFIIPAVPGCLCDYRCLALDAKRSLTTCICPKTWILDDNGRTCLPSDNGQSYPAWYTHVLVVAVAVVTITIGCICFGMYNRYQKRTEEVMRRKMLTGPDLQLNRLRIASDSMMTEYNPNYEFGGVIYTLKDLKDIPRDQLRLVKALGQGAFGEVYQGFYRQRSGDTVELPVAVKTLPEMSTNQAEMDFLMEALIMSKFNHPNIVHFIGVCFDKHPRFIVLELLAGGDLKNFLRESRPKPERGSPLSMKDLVLISVDVAKGCKYLEDNRFIHRDIAARNCLLTTKGPGRVVKIADFGMSRDIYRSDYYRKGGKAMLPIKWMPPEAFLDGIFTSKTDVWSFGVLLWEIMSMGYMPYTGCANRDVMQLVTSGGRLEPPANCPGPIYGIMTQCWHPTPEQRPTFTLILERLGYCVQDPQVMSAPLPIFNRPPSHERDATVMRPNSSDDNCLQVPQSADYLIPNHTPIPVPQHQPTGSTSSIDKLLPEKFESWETSFVLPQSKSTQPLLQESEVNSEEALDLIDAEEVNHKQQQASSISAKADSNLNSGISLDAAALAKQAKYANVKPKGELTGNGIVQNGTFPNPSSNYKNTSEISC
ncbi:PREDICTED: leukocyte tyrosine kinase receptor [Nicrophorus vespilloides]|uniref:Tyrosine-protein kinase receptor n=1 Tax=Nicrophorus vespilloides TaxID=110193 RepID=A0ABM1M2Z2_NICVS|nr:PREDICTED: leukocyte tyrosine kinase receptor [Nicrophorus vespilloides]